MLVPIKPLDFELTGQPAADLPVPRGYRAARVLVRWRGIPVGTVHAPVVGDRVRVADIVPAITRRLGPNLGPEVAARALRSGRGGKPLRFEDAPLPPESAPGPTISVVICTRDRPDDLEICLASINRLTPAPQEVIVVDNASRTEAVATLLRGVYPQFRYVREPTPGLDHARNRGIAEARHDVIAFTDDDVVVDPGWIGALADAFAADPTVGLVTGLIEPYELETEAQALFELYGGFGRGYRRYYVRSRPGAALPWHLIGAGRLGAGANMAVRRHIFADIGRFDPALDVGTPSLGGGDHEIFHRLIKSGWVCLYEPTALVRHRHRRTLEELRRLLYAYGYATRCYFERVQQNFPEDTAGVRRLTKWWWRHWALNRWWRAWMRPGGLSASLLGAEIRGFIDGRGGYTRSRKQVVSDERTRPDAFRLPAHDHPVRAGTDVAVVDVAEPLRDIPAGEASAVEVAVRLRDRALGSVRIASPGSTISARRLTDEIAQGLWMRLARPSDGDVPSAWAAVMSGLTDLLPVETPPPAPLPDDIPVTIVVCTCDRPEPLRRCLASLAALRTARPVQTVVVDNRPGSGLADTVVGEFPGVELVREPRRGSSYARNAGIAAARGEILVMTDDDMEVAPDWLEKIVAPFVRSDVVAATGITLAARVETAAQQHFETYGGFARGFAAQTFDADWFRAFRRAVPTWKIGGSGNAAFRTEIFAWPEIGGFDERLGSGVPTGVGEDTKLFYDILRAGYTIVYEPNAVAYHHHRGSMSALCDQLYGYARGHAAYHLITWLDHGDKRGLIRVGVELPLDFTRRLVRRLTGRYRYPLRLLLTEIAGTMAGPWSLWRAHRNVRRVGKGARRAVRAHGESCGPRPHGAADREPTALRP